MEEPRVKCAGCPAEIVWAHTASGKRMPFDVRASTDGQWELAPDGQTLLAIHLRPEFLAKRIAEGELFYTPHFATCPQAAKYRRSR